MEQKSPVRFNSIIVKMIPNVFVSFDDLIVRPFILTNLVFREGFKLELCRNSLLSLHGKLFKASIQHRVVAWKGMDDRLKR